MTIPYLICNLSLIVIASDPLLGNKSVHVNSGDVAEKEHCLAKAHFSSFSAKRRPFRSVIWCGLVLRSVNSDFDISILFQAEYTPK